jgi:hypothetical protein
MNMAVFLWLYYRIDEYATCSIESSKIILKEAAKSLEKSTQHMQHEKPTNTTTKIMSTTSHTNAKYATRYACVCSRGHMSLQEIKTLFTT